MIPSAAPRRCGPRPGLIVVLIATLLGLLGMHGLPVIVPVAAGMANVHHAASSLGAVDQVGSCDSASPVPVPCCGGEHASCVATVPVGHSLDSPAIVAVLDRFATVVALIAVMGGRPVGRSPPAVNLDEIGISRT